MGKDYVIGIDIGGTKVAYGLFDSSGTLICSREHPSDRDADGPAFSDGIIETVRSIIDGSGLSGCDIRGIGIGICSFILFDKGYIYLTSALEKIRDFAMRDYIEERLGIRVVLDNDANAAALAEQRRGAAKGRRDMVFMAFGTGIGSGIIINGEIVHGSYGWAGESGHMLITPDEGIECGCRNRGCFMSYASGMGIAKWARRYLDEGAESELSLCDDISAKDILAAYNHGDALAGKLVDQIAHYMGVCMFNIYQLLNINMFVLGGGLINFGDMLLDKIRAEFDRYNKIPLPVDIVFGGLKKDTGIIGAAELVR